jgi:hypothetical protein
MVRFAGAVAGALALIFASIALAATTPTNTTTIDSAPTPPDSPSRAPRSASGGGAASTLPTPSDATTNHTDSFGKGGGCVWGLRVIIKLSVVRTSAWSAQ